MSQINLKSITGITSITTPAGVDNVFTVHSNDTTERFRVDSNGNQVIAGILTVSQDLDVDGHTNLDNVSIAGVVTATSFSGPATQVSLAAQSSDTDCYPVFSLDATGNQALYTKSNRLSFNSATGALSATSFVATGDLDIDGHTNLDNVSIAGVTTTSGNIIIENAEPSIFFTDTNGNPDYKIFNDAGALKIYDTTYSATRLQIGPTNGEVTVASNTNFPNGITMNPGTASVVNTIAQKIGDTDTKIRFPAADTFTVETAGSERLRIHPGGQISSGVNNNSYEFTIGGLSGGPTLLLRDSGTSGTPRILFGSTAAASIGVLLYNNSSNHMELHTNGIERFRIETVSNARARFNFGAGNSDFTNPDIGGGTSGVSINKNTLGQIYACTDNADNTAANDYQTVCLNVSRRNTSGDGPQIALDRGGWIKASIAGLQGSNTATSGPGSFAIYTHNYSSGSNVRTQRFRISGSDGTVTVGDGNNLAQDFVTTMLIDGGDNSKLSIYGSSTGSGTIAFPDGSSTGAQRMAGFIQMNHTSNDNGPRLLIGHNDTSLVHIRVSGSNRGQLEVYGNFNESDAPAIEINDGGDARKVYLTNSSGDFNALTRNAGQTKGQLKMFESGILVHNMKDPDSTNTLQTFRALTYRNQTGSTNPSTTPDQTLIQKGGSGTYDCFYEGNMTLEVNGGGNDHYQPVAFVPLGYDLDTSSFGGQWAGEMWIHQTGSQNPTSYGYSGYNTWATMSFKCRWDCAHWNAKPSGFWVEHYINQGRAQIGKIDASTTMSQFVIYLLPGAYRIRYNCIRGMSVHRSSSDGGSITLRDGGSMATYSTLAYSSRNTSFDSEIAPGSATFAHCT